MGTIIQWNCRGLKIHFLEITLLVQAFLPVAFCLQESHLKRSDNISLKNYSIYSTYVDENDRAAGGSTILVKDQVLHSPVDLNTDLQAVAVRQNNNFMLCVYPSEFFIKFKSVETSY